MKLEKSCRTLSAAREYDLMTRQLTRRSVDVAKHGSAADGIDAGRISLLQHTVR